MKRRAPIERIRETFSAIVKGSIWIPFCIAPGVAGALEVIQTPAHEATHVFVRSESKGGYMTSVKHLLCTYRVLRSGDEILTPPQRAREIQAIKDIPNALRKLGASWCDPNVAVAAPAPIAPAPEDLGVHVYVFRGRPCVIAAAVGRALGYARNGTKLTDLIRLEWAGEIHQPRDREALRGEALREFKEIERLTTPSVVSRAPALMVLYETGFDLVLQKTDKPEGRQLRRRLAEEVLPKLRRGEPVQAAPAATPLPPSGVTLAEVLAIVDRANAPMIQAMKSMETLVAGLAHARQLPAAPVVVLIPDGWLTAEQWSLVLSDRLRRKVSGRKVHDFARNNGMRTDQHARQKPVEWRDVETGNLHQEPKWYYSPAVADAIQRFLAARSDDEAQQEIPETR